MKKYILSLSLLASLLVATVSFAAPRHRHHHRHHHVVVVHHR